MEYNEELMEIIDNNHLNSETKVTHANHNSMKLIDFDVNDCEATQQTKSIPSSSPIIDNEEILQQNVRRHQILVFIDITSLH